jgi:hypothetical protein
MIQISKFLKIIYEKAKTLFGDKLRDVYLYALMQEEIITKIQT